MTPRQRIKPNQPVPLSARIVEDAIEAILVYYSVLDAPINEQDLIGRSRDSYTVKVRAVVMFFLKTECHWSYPTIGARFERDHTSVINMVRRTRTLVPEQEMDDVYDYARTRVAEALTDRRLNLLRGVS